MLSVTEHECSSLYMSAPKANEQRIQPVQTTFIPKTNKD